MLYSEFLEGSRLPDNMMSWSIYNCLHKFYMQHDDIEKDTIYARGTVLYDDLMGVVRPAYSAKIQAYYHGEGSPFTYTCGRCGRHLHESNYLYCPYCGAEFELEQDKQPVKPDK